jgi:O-methyltransferase
MTEHAVDARRYLDLLKVVLLNQAYPEREAERHHLYRCAIGERKLEVQQFFSGQSVPAADVAAVERTHATGQHFGGLLRFVTTAATMVGRARIDSLHDMLDAVRDDAVAGDFVETGVWRGGVCAFAKGYFEAHGMTDRKVWLFDSFAGLPVPEHPKDDVDLQAAKYPMLAVSEAEVRTLFLRLGLDLSGCRMVKGFFEKTVPVTPVESIALLRLDGDYFSSTDVVLRHYYDSVSPGGYIVIDDYGVLEPCRQAVDTFRAERNIVTPMVQIDNGGWYWRKPG